VNVDDTKKRKTSKVIQNVKNSSIGRALAELIKPFKVVFCFLLLLVVVVLFSQFN